jgi:hypothetical protein
MPLNRPGIPKNTSVKFISENNREARLHNINPEAINNTGL